MFVFSVFLLLAQGTCAPIEIVSPLIMIDESVIQRRFSTRIQNNETEQSLFRQTGCCYHDESCKNKTYRIKCNFHRWIVNYISLKQLSTACFWFGMIINLIMNVIDYLIGHENTIVKQLRSTINQMSNMTINYAVRLFTYRWNGIETDDAPFDLGFSSHFLYQVRKKENAIIL